jgi:hypothetical protein
MLQSQSVWGKVLTAWHSPVFWGEFWIVFDLALIVCAVYLLIKGVKRGWL